MSNDMVRVGRSVLANSDSGSIRSSTRKGLAVTAVGGASLWLLAGLLPFITFPMLLVLAVLGAVFI